MIEMSVEHVARGLLVVTKEGAGDSGGDDKGVAGFGPPLFSLMVMEAVENRLSHAVSQSLLQARPAERTSPSLSTKMGENVRD